MPAMALRAAPQALAPVQAGGWRSLRTGKGLEPKRLCWRVPAMAVNSVSLLLRRIEQCRAQRESSSASSADRPAKLRKTDTVPSSAPLTRRVPRGSFVALVRWPHQRVPAPLASHRGTERGDDDNVRERACIALGAL